MVTVVLWILLNLPMQGDAHLRSAGVDPADQAATSSYVLDHSYAARIGHAVEPVFDPLGFGWRVDIGVLASLSAREVFVATLGQVAAAENPDRPTEALRQMTHTCCAPRCRRCWTALRVTTSARTVARPSSCRPTTGELT